MTQPSKIWSQPNFFTYNDSCKLSKNIYPIPFDLWLVSFRSGGIDEPNVEVLGLVRQAGILRVLWRDYLWSVSDWNLRDGLRFAQGRAEYRLICECLYATPSLYDTSFRSTLCHRYLLIYPIDKLCNISVGANQ